MGELHQPAAFSSQLVPGWAQAAPSALLAGI